MANYNTSTFPGATRTFSLYRASLVQDGQNQDSVGALQGAPIAKGLSVLYHDTSEDTHFELTGNTFFGDYVGSTWYDTPIQIKDIIVDETQTLPDGSQLAYVVVGQTVYAYVYAELRFKRTEY